MRNSSKNVPNPYDVSLGYSEWWACGEFKNWMSDIFQEKQMKYKAHIERIISGNRRNRPDITILDREKAICLIEVKPPSWDPLNNELVNKTANEAYKVDAKYFATWNVNKLVLFSTEEFRKKRTLYDAILQTYDVCEITELKEIEESPNTVKIKAFLERFLEELHGVYTGKKAIPKIPIDEYFISHLRITSDALSNSYKKIVMEEAQKNRKFRRDIIKWFSEQQWSFTGSPEDYWRLSRQAAYLLINKILFYTALQEKYNLDPLEIPKSLTKGKVLESILKAVFDEVLKIDYETIFTTDFIDKIAFPDDPDTVSSIRDLINEINRHKISSAGYDILGRIFESLIPDKERHKLGQYFTNSEVVDLILGLSVKSEEDKVLDPSCGAGTFLVRSYQWKRLMNPTLNHKKILPTLWGVDISKFACHLSTINLAIKDLADMENYPRIIHSDFFEMEPNKISFGIPPKKAKVKGMGSGEKEFEHPEYFDCIVGNPPYTRQEEMEDLTDENYKKELRDKALMENGRVLAQIGKRAGIHVYFFTHGYKFLKEGGRFGFIVSNSWMDVDYGKGLQEFFLKHYKIVAIIESKVERWFEDADVNTGIVILEKCGKKKERDENLVRFVQLKKPLSELIPPASKEFGEEVKRKEAIEDLINLIEAHRTYYENDELRMFPKKQKDLWEGGFDKESGKYIGEKWGKYIRAPPIFFKILEKGRNKLVPLREIADVRYPIKTGMNKFFYRTENEIKEFGIEKEFWMHPIKKDDEPPLKEQVYRDKKGKMFEKSQYVRDYKLVDLLRKDGMVWWVPNYVIKSPKECKSVVVDPKELKFRVLLICKDKKELKGTNALKYIQWGESQGFHTGPTCASRKRWYELPYQINRNTIICRRFFNEVHNWPYNNILAFVDQTFYIAIVKNIYSLKDVSSFLNSTLSNLLTEIFGRFNLGQGVLQYALYESAVLPVLNPASISEAQRQKLGKAFYKFSERNIVSIFEEIGALTSEEVSLDKVKTDRRELDEIVMGEILGLTDDEQLEVYRAVIDLVKYRIEKAKSVKKNSKKKKREDEVIAKRIIDSIGGEDILRNLLDGLKPINEVTLPEFKKEPKVRKTLTGWNLTDDKNFIAFDTQEEAEFSRLMATLGVQSFRIPKKVKKKDLERIESMVEEIRSIIKENIEMITDRKMKNSIINIVISRLTSGL